jgi:undecaprenyl-diphosphatase
MTILQAALLGLVQGFAEMLPISSSAHLVLTPWILGFTDPGLAFDVALHVGTLVAVLGYFWRDWVDMAASLVKLAQERVVTSQSQKLAVLLLIASVPGAIFGFLLNDYAETVFRNPLLVASALVVMGVVLWYADHHDKGDKDISQISRPDSFKIGLAQALAIIPGVSRSGATMTMGLFLGINRSDVAKFSFMMSAPIIAGAAILKIGDISAEMLTSSVFWVGMAAAAASSLFAIGFLLRFIRKHHFDIFVYYRFVLAALIVTVYLTRR